MIGGCYLGHGTPVEDILMKTQKDTQICVLFCVSIGTYTLLIKKMNTFLFINGMNNDINGI